MGLVNEFGEFQRSLLQAYQLWRDLTVSEAAALQSDDWVRVTECQSAKSDLQTRILHLTEAARRESALFTATSTKFEQQVRTLLVELISSENSNIELIQRRRCATEVQKKELDCMQMTLGRVHRTYGHSREICWSSYS